MIKLGLTRAYATKLQQIIAVNTSNRIKAFLAGIGVTTILQSSTATTMICTSFATKSMIGTATAIAIIIGADIGTTLVAQILTFDLSWLMPLLILGGVTLHNIYKDKGRRKHLARAMIGLGLVLLSLSLIKQSALPLGESETLPLILKPLESEPLLALLVAGVLTWLLHSSLATILIIASFTSSGLISFKLGLLLVLGANLGGAIIPFALCYNMGAKARRITSGNLIMRITCIIITLPFTNQIAAYFGNIDIDQSRELINFHMGFNIMLAILFLPFVGTLATLTKKLISDDVVQDDDAEKPLYLDHAALETPTIALASAARETLRAAKIVEEMLSNTMLALKEERINLIDKTQKEDVRVDTLHNHIKMYLTKVSQSDLDPKESDRFIQILTFSTNLEHIGDIIDTSLLEIAKTKVEAKKRFSKEGFKEIMEFHNTVLSNMKIAQAIFMSEDPKLAQKLVEGKGEIRKAAEYSAQKHFERLREGVPETQLTSALHTDIIRDYKRINSYITTIAFAILNNAEKHKNMRKEDGMHFLDDQGTPSA